MEGVYVKVTSPAFCLFLYLVGVNFQGKLQHGGDVSQQKNQVSTSLVVGRTMRRARSRVLAFTEI